MHMALERFGVGMDAGLLAAFDQLLDRQGYPNRSEAIRDLVRASLAADALADVNQPAFGVVVVMYDHHKPDLVDQLISIQHDAPIDVVCSTHVHIDARNCAEAIFAVGTAGEIRDLGQRLAALKGVARGESIILARPGDPQ
jgi:CopG family nickel-responsive transcriptional regulator